MENTMMSESVGVSSIVLLEDESGEPSVQVACEHPLSRIDPSCLDLPGPNWAFCKIDGKSLIICEVMMASAGAAPRIRKHVHMNLTNGICTSYVMDREISVMPAVTRIDIERCIEELHMMHVCVGGPAASRFPPSTRTNSRVDTFGNWRHNSCKIVASWTGLPCKACESLQYELSELLPQKKKKKSNGDGPRRVTIANLSHRKQSQIISLRKRRQSWYRKKRNAEKEMKIIEDMISEVFEEPEENDGMGDDYEDDD